MYYKKISSDEYSNIIFDDKERYENWVDITANQKYKLEKATGINFTFKYASDKCYLTIATGMIFYPFYIHQLKDEWFYVGFNYREYYKCDQLEGLISCIKTLSKKYGI